MTSTIVGKQKHFQANHAAPIFHELCGIVMKTVALSDPLRAALHPLAKRIDLALVWELSVMTASLDNLLRYHHEPGSRRWPSRADEVADQASGQKAGMLVGRPCTSEVYCFYGCIVFGHYRTG